MTFKLLPLLLALIPTALAAQGATQDLDALERRLVISLGADIGQPGGPRAVIDRRMKLAACPAAITIDPPVLGAVALRCEAIGWRIRVPLLAGASRLAAAAPVPVAPMVKAAPVIRRGDPVELSAGDAGFTVTREVIAEQDGAPGERIRVRPEGKSPLMAEVVDSGRARLAGH